MAGALPNVSGDTAAERARRTHSVTLRLRYETETKKTTISVQQNDGRTRRSALLAATTKTKKKNATSIFTTVAALPLCRTADLVRQAQCAP
jgi:hypothetical protein